MEDLNSSLNRKQENQNPIKKYTQFPNSHSSEGQETFVLNVLNEKTNGYYLEIGSNHPRVTSNTYLLENDYGWRGLALDVDQYYVDLYNSSRKNVCLNYDASTFNYTNYFEENDFPAQIDYLQIDVDDRPRHLNLQTLIQLPLSTYRFSVITIEHGYINDYTLAPMRDAQRLILSSYGYKLVVRGVNEDWWVDETVVPQKDFWHLYRIDA
jgi:hypothetical protein